VAEQATALTSLAGTAARETSALAHVAGAATEHVASLARLTVLVGQLKLRTKETAGAIDLQMKNAGAAADDLRSVTAEIAQIRALADEQTAMAETLVEELLRHESVRQRRIDEKDEAS
jgi:hypothetical protein